MKQLVEQPVKPTEASGSTQFIILIGVIALGILGLILRAVGLF